VPWRRAAIHLFALLCAGCHGLARNPAGTVAQRQLVENQRARQSVPSIEPAVSNGGGALLPVNDESGCAPGTPGVSSHALQEALGYPDSFHFTDDLREFPCVLFDDARAISNPENVLILAVAAGAAVGIRQAWDDQVREETAEHPLRWGEGSRVLGNLGEAQYQVPVLASAWALSVWSDDPGFHDFNETLISAYTLNGMATLAIKGVTNTSRPDSDWNGGQWGFPSFHASSTFTIAAVLEDYYGWKAGLPAYALAGLVSWSRIDERDHDLSDVVFGAAMGYVIGKSVADFHLGGDGHVRLTPWCHPTEGATGVMLETRF
jgi:hypothetical protein